MSPEQSKDGFVRPTQFVDKGMLMRQYNYIAQVAENVQIHNNSYFLLNPGTPMTLFFPEPGHTRMFHLKTSAASARPDVFISDLYEVTPGNYSFNMSAFLGHETSTIRIGKKPSGRGRDFVLLESGLSVPDNALTLTLGDKTKIEFDRRLKIKVMPPVDSGTTDRLFLQAYQHS